MSLQRLNSWHLDLMIWVTGTLALLTCVVLEYLAQFKAGVMRHLYYHKAEHLAGTFSSDMQLYQIGFAVVLFVIAALWSMLRDTPLKQQIHLMCSSALFMAALCLPRLQEFYSYTYMLFTGYVPYRG
ncbi:hypothetical protein [Endozoicomonas euniceicola]|uniref:Uncharacterized protein n=1 Tax=Endozoicomonas euniceicola TaxID=1234143 RepID=A0ABY6GU80_9GAMM|nr:hypothetical protein [Endozoicomonas euniceicola]UYM16332.1 hypothetical protein NX720_26655 [Endozoicomonas euniceicola]